MRTLLVQIQPRRVEGLDARSTEAEFANFGEHSENVANQVISTLNDDGLYINVSMKTTSLANLFDELKTQFLTQRSLADATIVTCEGSNGWDDYLLLHHFDPDIELDVLG